MFASPKSRHIWVASRRNMNSMPDCPPDLSEPQYASLMFEHHCQVRTITPLLDEEKTEILMVRLVALHVPRRLIMPSGSDFVVPASRKSK